MRIENESNMDMVEQIEMTAKEAWGNHPLSQAIKLGDRVFVCAMVEDLVVTLQENPVPIPQILDKVYLERREYPWREGVNEPRVGVSIVGEAVDRFLDGGVVDAVYFETHPEWTLEERAADKRWLTVVGNYFEDGPSHRWANEYIFENYSIKKRERVSRNGIWEVVNEDAVLNQPDLDIIGGVLVGIRNQVIPLLTQPV